MAYTVLAYSGLVFMMRFDSKATPTTDNERSYYIKTVELV